MRRIGGITPNGLKLIQGDLLDDDEKVKKDFKLFCKGIILRKNKRLKGYFEGLLPFAGISFKGWKYELGKELNIEMELKTVTCPNFDEIKFVKRYLFKFYNLKSCELFVRNEMTYWDEVSEMELIKIKSKLENKIMFYQFCMGNKDIVVSFIDSVYNFWLNKSYSEIEVGEWKKIMTSNYLAADFFELVEKTQKSEIVRFDAIFNVFGAIKKEKGRFIFKPESDYDPLKRDIDRDVCMLFNLETLENNVFLKLEEFKNCKKKGISLEKLDEGIINEIETKMMKKEGLFISELREMTGLVNGKEIAAFLKQFKGVNKRRERINGKLETNYYLYKWDNCKTIADKLQTNQ